MKRFLKTFLLLIVGLFVLASGLDAALDRITRSATQSSFTVYSEQGKVLLAFEGDLAAFKTSGKPGAVIVPRFLHRT